MLPVPTLQISHIGEEEDVYKAEIVIHVLGSIRGGKTPSEPQSEAVSPTASCFGDDSVDILESTSSSLIGSPLELSPRSPISALSSKRVSPRPHPYSLAPPSAPGASFLVHNPTRSGPLSPPAQMDAEEARLAEEEKREKRREKDRIRKRIQREKQRREKQSSGTPPPPHASTSSAQQQTQQQQQSIHMMQQMQMQMQLQMHIGNVPVSTPPLLSPSSSGSSSSISSFAPPPPSGGDVGSIPSLSSFLAATQQQQQHHHQQQHLGHQQQMNGTLPPFSLSFCN